MEPVGGAVKFRKMDVDKLEGYKRSVNGTPPKMPWPIFPTPVEMMDKRHPTPRCCRYPPHNDKTKIDNVLRGDPRRNSKCKASGLLRLPSRRPWADRTMMRRDARIIALHFTRFKRRVSQNQIPQCTPSSPLYLTDQTPKKTPTEETKNTSGSACKDPLKDDPPRLQNRRTIRRWLADAARVCPP